MGSSPNKQTYYAYIRCTEVARKTHHVMHKYTDKTVKLKLRNCSIYCDVGGKTCCHLVSARRGSQMLLEGLVKF